jgi:hypothetical protein
VSTETDPIPEADAAPDGSVACVRCGRRFVRAELLALHRGLDHFESLDAAEREAFAAARKDEREALRLFRLKALFALVVLYFGLLLVYAFVG